MRVAVFGAGAMGSLLGALLSREAQVVLIARPRHAAAVRASGLRVSGLTRGVFDLDTSTAPSAAAKADLVLVTTKAYDTRAAARSLRRAGGRAPVLSLQNGLTNVPTLLHELPGRPILGGSTSHGVTYLRPGAILHAGTGETTIGAARGSRALARSTARLLTRAGIETAATDHLRSVLWRKAVVNAAVNPLTAILRCPNGALLDRPEVKLVAKLAALEAAAVARRDRARVPRDPWPGVERVLARTALNRSSMLQDVEAGRRTEIDAITGEIVRIARRRGIAAPVNAGLLRLVRAL